jgi:hypothetical protein
VQATVTERCLGQADRGSAPARIYACAAVAGLALICAIALTIPNLFSISFLFERNYNEGWNVYNAQRFLHHAIIYDNNYWRVNNYPIGSFLLIEGVNFLVHDLLLSGRLVALVSFAVIGVLAAIAVRSFGGDRIDAIFGAACALGFCYLVAPAWIMADDPQTLGEAVMLGGLASYLSGAPRRPRLLLTALLVVLAGFIKHNLVAIPLAITLDLAVRTPRRLPFWLLCCAGFSAGFLGLTQIVAGGTFIDHLRSPRIFTWHGARYHLMKYLRLFKFPLFAMAPLSLAIFSGRRFILAGWGIVSIGSATIFSGFEGTSYNMFQDAAVFLGVAAGVTFCVLRKQILGESVSRLRFVGLGSGVLILLLAQPIFARSASAFGQIYNSGALLELNRRAEAIFLSEAKYISARRGPAICESLLLCYIAGQPFILDPFNSRQYILAGKLDEGELIHRIATHEFAVIQVRADICDDPATVSCHTLHYPQKFNRFTDDTLYAIDRYYQIGWRSQDGTFYIPK